jgi:hypothetical protein
MLHKYEDMINNFRCWLNKLLLYCDLNIGEDFFSALMEKNERVKPKNVNIQRHMRRGKPCEYKEKYKRDTVEYLNVKFSPMLLAFGYRFDDVH